ncbi:conserved hypothetical protein [Tenacibaculum sp. 190524A05c]|uniref:hypothetical protein n=1 Tax=Tenacibaculum platacis TaxID=3137852 RepID=UPI0031FB6EED
MSITHKEKHLQATIFKIENVKREQDFLLRHLWKVIGLGILFSFWAPTRRPKREFLQHGESMLDLGEYSYTTLVLICAGVYTSLCFIYYVVSKYQDQRKLKNLEELKRNLEREIKEYNQ